jgi:cytochrome c oxidase subunit IV
MSDTQHVTDHGHGHDHESDHETGHHSHGTLYLFVFLALCGFTGLSILADLVKPHDVDKTSTIYRAICAAVLAVATCKALCVMLYFMHLKFERAWKYLLLAPTFILAFTIPFALAPDVGMHYYTVDVPQVHEYEARQAAGGGHGGSHAPAKTEHH